MRLIPLSSRASAPDHCAECDGHRDGPGALCTECAGASLIQRVSNRYSDDQGIVDWWSTYQDEHAPYYQLVREFHPLIWGLGIEAQHEVGCQDWPSWWSVSLTLGPFSLTFRRVRALASGGAR